MARTSATTEKNSTGRLKGLIGSVNRDKLAKDKRSGSSFWKVPEGRGARIIILPPGADSDEFYAVSAQHWYNNQSFQCLKNIDGASAKCFFCMKAAKARDEEQKALFRARTSYNFNIFNLSEPDEGIQTWSAGVKVGKKILGIIDTEGYTDILDPEVGRFFFVSKKGTGRTTEYDAQPGPDRQPWPDSLIELIEETGEIPNISDTVFKTHTSDEMKAAYESYEEDDDEEDDDAPRARAATSKATQRNLNVASRGSSRKSEVIEDDDDDEEDEDDDLPVTADDDDEEDDDDDTDSDTSSKAPASNIAALRKKLQGK